MRYLILILLLVSCKVKYTTAYKIETAKNNYYTNEIKIIGDSISFKERRREVEQTFHLKDVKIIYNN